MLPAVLLYLLLSQTGQQTPADSVSVNAPSNTKKRTTAIAPQPISRSQPLPPIVNANDVRIGQTTSPLLRIQKATQTESTSFSTQGGRVVPTTPVAKRKSVRVANRARPISPIRGAADTAVVVPRVFLTAIQPWLNHRTSQGHQLVIIDPHAGPSSIRKAIRHAARGGQLRYVVLVGDSEPMAHIDPLAQARNVPAFLKPARVNIKWGSEPEIATDNPYADLDNDGLPDIAVGRIPANSSAQLSEYVEKIIQYERQPRVGQWQRKVNFVAGVGDFGMITDAIIESTAKRIITNGIQPEYDISMTYGSWRSPYCPDPRRFREVAIERLNEGSLFWVYIGHGMLDSLDEIRLPNSDQSLPIFERKDLQRLDCRRGQPIALMLACYTGAFDHSQECLGEEMLMKPHGPIAVIAGSRVTMPYAMTIMGTGMLESFFSGRCNTVGDLLLQGKQHLIKSQSDRVISRKLLDSMARAMHADNEDLVAERREHLLLFNLLGDPLLRIPVPQSVQVSTVHRATGGKTIVVRGNSPIAGKAVIELVCRRDRMRVRTNRRLRYDDSEGALVRMDQVYRFANDKRWAATQVQLKGGRFQTTIRIPDDALGHAHVRVAVQDHDSFALGTHDLYIQPPKNLAEAAK